MDPYRFTPGTAPLMVSMPHVGTHVPPEIVARLSAAAGDLPDTDWHVDRLYDFLDDLGAARIAANYSRYMIDLNRAPDSKLLYPGASNTELCPTTTFAGGAVYQDGQSPDHAEVAERRAAVWQPYHDRIAAELAAIKARHGAAVLWDAHSIRSQVPRFFESRLPDLNLGSAEGTTADVGLLARLAEVAGDAEGYSHVLDGRFKGGYITRAYGDPANGIHAVQLELSQVTYMDEDPPYAFREDLARGIRPILRHLLSAALDWTGGVTGT
jgi:N-formylglutamate deformylase